MANVVCAVGSTNAVKVNAARSPAFPEPVHVVGYAVPSGVSAQPMGDAETRSGAMTRARAAAEAHRAATCEWPTWAVGLEGGCGEEDFDAPSLVGAPVRHRTLTCFAFAAVLHVPTGRWGIARSGAFALPPRIAKLVRGGMELGDADDIVFGRSGSKQLDGAVGLLTGGAITRTAYYDHAMTLACIPFGPSEALYAAQQSPEPAAAATGAL